MDLDFASRLLPRWRYIALELITLLLLLIFAFLRFVVPREHVVTIPVPDRLVLSDLPIRDPKVLFALSVRSSSLSYCLG